MQVPWTYHVVVEVVHQKTKSAKSIWNQFGICTEISWNFMNPAQDGTRLNFRSQANYFFVLLPCHRLDITDTSSFLGRLDILNRYDLIPWKNHELDKLE